MLGYIGRRVLLAAFTVRKAEPLPVPQPSFPAAFDRAGALTLARELAGNYPDRVPGTAGAADDAPVWGGRPPWQGYSRPEGTQTAGRRLDA